MFFQSYYLIHGIRDVPMVVLTPTSFFASLLGLSLAVGVTIAVEILFVIQVVVGVVHAIVFGGALLNIIFWLDQILQKSFKSKS